MKRKPTKADLARLDAIKESEIDYIDSPATTESFWADADVVMPGPKTSVTLRLDNDLLAWFKAPGRGYQTRINAVLRHYVTAASRKSPKGASPRPRSKARA